MTLSLKKPYAEACDKNGPPILAVLKEKLSPDSEVLEIGSGTGQHAVQFCRELPKVSWQTSDLREAHEGIQLWIGEAKLGNLLPPMALDVITNRWPEKRYDTVYTANTTHIMPIEAVEKMFEAVPGRLKDDGLFIIYGPFMYDGNHTSESNLRFDQWLRSQEKHRGLRDVTWLKDIAAKSGLDLDEDIEMPANNRILIWRHKK